MLDKVHAGSFLVLLLLGIASHVYSFIRLLEKNKQKRTNKSAIIYRNVFAIDIFIFFCFFPFKLIWLLFSKSNIVCKITRFSGFMGFYGVMSLLIIMSLDRYLQLLLKASFKWRKHTIRYFAIFKPLLHRTNRYHKILIVSLSSTWLFSLAIGLCHGIFIHQIGHAMKNREYLVCGVHAGPHVPYQGNPNIQFMFLIHGFLPILKLSSIFSHWLLLLE